MARCCRDVDTGEVRVYPGKLQVSEAFCIVPITESTTVADLIKEAIVRFRLESDNCEDYRCSEILLDRGGNQFFLSFSHGQTEVRSASFIWLLFKAKMDGQNRT